MRNKTPWNISCNVIDSEAWKRQRSGLCWCLVTTHFLSFENPRNDVTDQIGAITEGILSHFHWHLDPLWPNLTCILRNRQERSHLTGIDPRLDLFRCKLYSLIEPK